MNQSYIKPEDSAFQCSRVHGCQHLGIIFGLERIVRDVIRLGHILLTLLDELLKFWPLNFILAEPADVALVDSVLIIHIIMIDLHALIALLCDLIDKLKGVQEYVLFSLAELLIGVYVAF